jgi:CheY-like chemotaxis protein
LPCGGSSPLPPASGAGEPVDLAASPARGRVLVIDDEEAIGRVVSSALSLEHDVTMVQRASDAFVRFVTGERFDLVLCDVLMPVVSGPEVYATIAERWPDVLPSLVFMTGGAFTPSTSEFIARSLTPVLPKPFHLSELMALIQARVTQRVGVTASH